VGLCAEQITSQMKMANNSQEMQVFSKQKCFSNSEFTSLIEQIFFKDTISLICFAFTFNPNKYVNLAVFSISEKSLQKVSLKVAFLCFIVTTACLKEDLLGSKNDVYKWMGVGDALFVCVSIHDISIR